jgi:flavodoxin
MHMAPSDTVRRRDFLRLAATGAAGAAVGIPLSACGASSARDGHGQEARPASSDSARARRILLAYFSRPGENYWNGGRRDLEVGNTEVLARLIGARLHCHVHRIRARDPYPDDYDATVARNVREQNADARPAIANRLASIDSYDTILLASPIWNVRAPMIMSTFAERYDFAGKTVHPITTYAMSGLGTTPEDYAGLCDGARIGRALAVRGEEVRTRGEDAVDGWLRRTRLR